MLAPGLYGWPQALVVEQPLVPALGATGEAKGREQQERSGRQQGQGDTQNAQAQGDKTDTKVGPAFCLLNHAEGAVLWGCLCTTEGGLNE